jgi:hypothetical protein
MKFISIKKSLKAHWVLVSILFGLLTFVSTILFLNQQVILPKGDITFVKSDSTYYAAYSDGKPDTMFTSSNLIHSPIPKKDFFYNRFPSLLTWIFLVAILTGFSFCLIPIYFIKIREYQGKKIDLLYAIIFILILFSSQIFTEWNDCKYILMPQNMGDTFGVGIKGIGLQFYSIIPFIPVLFWIVVLISMIKYAGDQRNNAVVLKELKSSFEAYFFIMAILLGLSIFCNSLYANTINNMLLTKSNFKAQPSEFAYINAIMYSFVLVITYVAVHSYLKHLDQNNTSEDVNPSEVVQGPKSKKTVWDYIIVILSMLAPIIGSGLIDIIKILGA